MTKREKIIARLQDLSVLCAGHGEIQTMRTLDDAIALLKEQEPRVLTKSEAISYPEMKNAFDESDKPPLYVEYKTPQGYFVKWVSVDNVYLWMNDFELNMDYGKEFRFWTSRPTEEQRKVVKWGV